MHETSDKVLAEDYHEHKQPSAADIPRRQHAKRISRIAKAIFATVLCWRQTERLLSNFLDVAIR